MKIQICIMVLLYGDNKLQRLHDHIISDPHFVGFNYYQSYRVFLQFDESEDYVAFLEDLKFKLSMGSKAATVCILALVKAEQPNFCFNLSYSEYVTAKSDTYLFPNTDTPKTIE